MINVIRIDDRKIKLRIAVIECPYFTLENDKAAQLLFGKLIGMRSTGYRERYSGHVFPFGPEDFMCDHYIICEESEGDLIPIYSYKQVFLEECENYNLILPIVRMVMSKGNDPAILKILESYIRDRKDEGKKICYYGSRTMSPMYSKMRSIQREVSDMLSSTLLFSSEQKKVDVGIAACVLKGNAYKFAEKIGFRALTESTFILPELATESYLHVSEGWSSEAINEFERYRKDWDRRISFNPLSSRLQASA